MEQLSTLGVLTSAMLQQILANPSLALRLASIKSYDEYTLYHSVNVCVIAIGLGVAIGLPENVLRELAISAVLHDLGKIAVPIEILRKPGLLEEQEWRIMRRHPVRGADLLSRMPGSNRLPMIVSFEHQMRYDGKGYPFVREDWEQHPFSRIVCLADIFDAMTTRRAYKKAIPTEKVLAYLRDEAGKACDPRLVSVLEQVVRTLPAEAVPEDAPA
jgi:HD-GYP domain-containing protein (c-di-GMP phosphodiesterase class II)